MRAPGKLNGIWVAIAGVLLSGVVGLYYTTKPSATSAHFAVRAPVSSAPQTSFRHQEFGNFTLWWDPIPLELRMAGSSGGSDSNIHPDDYAGPAACKNCHQKQYNSWSTHPHRWMNAFVENANVRGDFNDRRISYLGGNVTFYKVGEQYRMRLERNEIRREYVVEQTIGSRHFQYYVGTQLEGPEATDHPLYSEAHVLPLGFWIDREEWVPTVHVGPEISENERPDPFVIRPPYTGNMDDYCEQTLDLYRSQCNFCHTTFPLGDMFVRFPRTIGRHVPALLDVSLQDYLKEARPEFWPTGKESSDMSDDEFASILREFHRLDAGKHAVTLGVSCEACHLGAKDHAAGKAKRPKFFPGSLEVVVRSNAPTYDSGRTHENVNWACGRCHAGERPQYANGTSTWNSTEYTDAMRGSCYSELTCIRCHNPHESIGHEWSRTPAEDDSVCLSCHQKFEPEEARLSHTHHPLDSNGSRCMNCHMPRINEGLQEVVRTHTIFSPTDQAMIHANQVNACNQCHVEQPIDWTLTHLKDWYGQVFSESEIAANYPNRDQPTSIGWLKSDNESVRLVAADALTRVNAQWALPELLSALDDAFLLNRQFARIGLERMLGLKLSQFGYEFYQTPDERKTPLQQMKEKLLPGKVSDSK